MDEDAFAPPPRYTQSPPSTQTLTQSARSPAAAPAAYTHLATMQQERIDRDEDAEMRQDQQLLPPPALPSLPNELARTKMRPLVLGDQIPPLRVTVPSGMGTGTPRSGNGSTTSSPSSDDAGAATSGGESGRCKRKAQRFLSDIERFWIVRRLDRGEKQVDLAREFGVTRATICNINKNREEIQVRYEILARSDEGRQQIERFHRAAAVSAAIASASVKIVHTATTQILLSRLQDERVDAASARAALGRLSRILLEEALASFGTKSIAGAAAPATEDVVTAMEYARRICAVTVCHQDGSSLCEEFARMEPSAARGSIELDKDESADWRIRSTNLPVDIMQSSVVLLQVACLDAALICKALEALHEHKVDMSSVCLVSMLSTSSAIAAVSAACADVRMLTLLVVEDVASSRNSLLWARLTQREDQ